MTQIHLLIPKLLSPLTLWNKDFAFTPEPTVISALLANSHVQATKSHSLEHTLFNKLGLESRTELPIAYYRYQLDFGTTPDCHVMCADPINLQAGTDEIILTPESIDDLSKADANELIHELNKHFAQDKWEFVVADSGNWYLKHQSSEAINTAPLSQAKGESVFKHLPQSSTLNWHSLQNEIQMLLHMAPLNQMREIAGQLPINSLWFWGAGKSATLEHDIDALWGDDAIIDIAALTADIPHKPLSKLNELNTGNHIIILDSLYSPAVMDNYVNWEKQYQELEANILTNIIKIAKNKKQKLIINDCNGTELTINHKKSWKFWKKETISLLDLSKRLHDNEIS